MQPTNQQPVYNVQRHYTSYGALVALGVEVERREILRPIREQVHIKQKVIKDTPVEKLTDVLVSILAGAQGIVETNKRVHPEKVLQMAFGRRRCGEQSVLSETLNACTIVNVEQMQQAMQEIYQRHSQGYHHDYDADWQLLDVDMTGQPCGKKAEFASRGYFAKQRNRRGRQLGRVLASWYDEVVVDRLYEGKTQLSQALQELVSAAAATMDLDVVKQRRTIVRIDGHGGSLDDVNWLLAQGYHIHTKEYSTKRALGITKRNKKSFTAQQMLVQLNALAHNLLVWFQAWLAQQWQAIRRLGLLRINAFVRFDSRRTINELVLNRLDPFAPSLCLALRPLLPRSQIDIILGET